MNAYYYPYQLRPRKSLNRIQPNLREGVLLRWDQSDGVPAFADCCPLVEFGEDCWQEQFHQYQKGITSPRIKKSYELAIWESEARRSKTDLLKNAHLVRNHFLISDFKSFSFKDLKELKDKDFCSLKIKIGRFPKEEAQWITDLNSQLPQGFKVRLDANCAFEEEEFSFWWSQLPSAVKANIEFVEDPCPLQLRAWRRLKSLEGLRLALDMAGEPIKELGEVIDVLVIKPAIQEVEVQWQNFKDSPVEFVLTHSMDHPLGQISAMAIASEFKVRAGERLRDCGLLGGSLFDPVIFSDRVDSTRPWICANEAFGWGVAEELMNLPWEKWK